MSWIFPVLMILIFLAVVATNYTEGMWSNAINLVNVVTAALLAVNFFEPLAGALDDWQPTFTYVWDFISIWALFCVFMLIFRVLTDSISRGKSPFSEARRSDRQRHIVGLARLGRRLLRDDDPAHGPDEPHVLFRRFSAEGKDGARPGARPPMVGICERPLRGRLFPHGRTPVRSGIEVHQHPTNNAARTSKFTSKKPINSESINRNLFHYDASKRPSSTYHRSS